MEISNLTIIFILIMCIVATITVMAKEYTITVSVTNPYSNSNIR